MRIKMNWKLSFIACVVFLGLKPGHCDVPTVSSESPQPPSFLEESVETPLLSDAKEDKQKSRDKELDTRISKLETDMQKVRGKTEYGNFGAKTASGNPQVDGYGFSIAADFLFWKLYEGGTDYLLKSKNHQLALPVKATLQHFNFDWEPGFKVSAGYLFEHDGWDTNLEYTYYKSHARHSSKGDFLFPLVGNESLALSQAKGRWHVFFQNLNFLLGRNYFVSKSLSLHPLFGITSAWIDQHRYFHFTATSTEQITLKSRNDFWGIGPHLGLDTKFYLGKNFSIYGNVSGSLLWGDFHVNEKEANKTAGLTFYHLHDDLHRMVPNGAFALGLSYETSFSEDFYHLSVKAGYENQYWFRQNQLPLFDVNGNAFHRVSDDLSMQGLTVEARLDF